eukprot:PITA_26511
METVRAVLPIAAQNKWNVYQMDVKSAFLNGVLKEKVYIEQPLAYEKKCQEHKVCRLKKSLYGLNDWVGSVDDWKSTSGYVFHMGSGAISWASNKQSIVALSIAEAEYVAATASACQAVWMKRMLRSLGQEQAKETVIFCDNSSVIALSKNSVFHKRTKHIDTRFHYIRELVNNGEIILQHCSTQEQVANILTKPLGHKSFEFLRKCLGITECPVVEIKGEC